MLRDFTQATCDELMAELDSMVSKIVQEAYDSGVMPNNGTFEVSGSELERLANEMGLDVDLEDGAYTSLGEHVKAMEAEVTRQKEQIKRIWENVNAVVAEYAYKFELLEAESRTYLTQVDELVELLNPEQNYFNENPTNFSARCNKITNVINKAASDAELNLELARMGEDGNYNWGYIQQVMHDDNASDTQIAALMIIFLGMEDTADMEQFIKCGYQSGFDEENNVETLSLTPTFLRVSYAAGVSISVLGSVFDDPNTSPADYDAQKASDYMRKLGLLLIVGANHSNIQVMPNWYEFEDPVQNPSGRLGGNGVPVRIEISEEGNYTVVCSTKYPYNSQFDGKPGTAGNGYYHITGILSDEGIVLSKTESVNIILEGLRPNTNGIEKIGKESTKFVVDFVVGEALEWAFNKPVAVAADVVMKAIEGAIGWVKDIGASNTITNTQEFQKYVDRVYLLGGSISYTVDEKGVYTVHYIGFNSPEAFFRIQGYLEMYGGDRDALIAAVLAGKQPEYGQFRAFIKDDGHDTFKNNLVKYHDWLLQQQEEEKDSEDEEEPKPKPRVNFEELSTNELIALNEQMKNDEEFQARHGG